MLGTSVILTKVYIFLLTVDQLYRENITVYLDIYEIPFGQLNNQVFTYRDKCQFSRPCYLTVRGKETEGTESS